MPVLVVVANDGLKGGPIKLGNSWAINCLRETVEHFGNSLYQRYGEAAKWMLSRKAQAVGYKLSRWTSYYCGTGGSITHWCGVLKVL